MREEHGEVLLQSTIFDVTANRVTHFVDKVSDLHNSHVNTWS